MSTVMQTIGEINNAHIDSPPSILVPLYRNIPLTGCPDDFAKAFEEYVAACESGDRDAFINAHYKIKAVYDAHCSN